MIFDLLFTKSILFFINLVAYLDEPNITRSHFIHKLNFFFIAPMFVVYVFMP